MNSVSHQQRMMEIQHMSNACLVTLLPRVQESLQGTSKDGSVLEEMVCLSLRGLRGNLLLSLKCKHNHIKDDFSCLMFVSTPERKEKNKSTGVPHVTPTSPAAS